MKRILRNDFIIEQLNNNSLVLKSKSNTDITFSILQAEAVYLSLFDGIREDDEVKQISFELFGENSSKLKSVDRFLLPVEIAYSLFGRYEHKYTPMQFLTQKYHTENKNSRYLHIPRYITLCLTHKCHRRCIYCYAGAPFSNGIENDAMPNLMIKKILNEAFEMAIEGVLLTGGEPMMHPHVYDLINYLGNRAIYTQVLTKHLLNKENLKRINTSSLDLYLSIDSNNPALANWLTGSKYYYNDMMKNDEMLNKIGIPFKATTVITRKNKSNILDIVHFLLSIGATRVLTNHYSCEVKDKVVPALMLKSEEKREFDTSWTECIKEHELGNVVFHKKHPSDYVEDLEHMDCSGLTKKVTIDFNGEYILCDRLSDVQIDFGNIWQKSILEHWNSEVMQNLRYPKNDLYKTSVCGNCNRFKSCYAKNSCYARSIIQHGTMYHPVKEVEYVCDKR
jgi:radical SAM protein with 4Fe4S-binding SPASM domain